MSSAFVEPSAALEHPPTVKDYVFTSTAPRNSCGEYADPSRPHTTMSALGAMALIGSS